MRAVSVLFYVLTLILVLCSNNARNTARAQAIPTSVPTTAATTAPTTAPTTYPTVYATTYPTSAPAYVIAVPTTYPTTAPTTMPTTAPTVYPTTAPTSFPTLVPGTPPPAHVLTSDYMGTLAEAQNCAALAPYISYVYPKGDQYGAWHACGVKTIRYEDPAMPQGSDAELALITGSYTCAAAKDSSGNYVRTYSGTGYLYDPHSTCASAYLQAALDNAYALIGSWNNGIEPDAVFFDNWNDVYGESAAPVDFSTYADWTSATNASMSGLNTHGAALFLNTLAVQSISNQLVGLAPSVVTGGEYENCFQSAPAWASTENAQISALGSGKVFWCYTNGAWSSGDGSAVSAQRIYDYASFLLTYDLGRSIYQTYFATPSTLKVMPETGFVATGPLQTAKSAVSELLSSGVYVRQFSACYYRDVPVGACAVVVNPSTAAVPVSFPAFAHSVVVSGSDALDGGSLSYLGPAVTQLAPQSAAILTP